MLLVTNSCFFLQETWYEVVQKKNSTVVYGRLRHKYYSVRRTLVNACLLDKDVLRAELDEDEPPSNPGQSGYSTS